MLKARKCSFWMTVILLIGMVASFLIGFIPSAVETHAETNYFSAEQYTESDQLLQADGSESSRDIRDFAKDVISGGYNQSFPELAQVVPLEYLETTEVNAEFAYNGKEYGFYLAKEGEYFDLLLIDFIYEFDDEDHSDLEYKIRIEPILMQSFWMVRADGQLQWRKTNNYNLYFVSNPRFLTVVRNENALNYGDYDYSKLSDDGVIIIQSRVNYSTISYKTEEEIAEECKEFAINKALSTVTDLAVKVVDKATNGVAELLNYIFTTAAEFSATLYDAKQAFIIPADNEENIFTEQSKSTQRTGPKDGYSRVAGSEPETDIVLGVMSTNTEEKSEKTYAEFITVLNETNYRTRLNQFCQFDIVKVCGSDGSLKKLNNPNGGESYSFSKERILFSEGSEKSLAFDTAQATYNLPRGTDAFTFSPTVSGTYTFTADEPSANLSLYRADDQENVIFSGSNSDSAYLQGGTDYLLYAGMNSDENGRYTIQATVSTWESGTTKTNQPIPAGGQLYKLSASERGGYQISSSNENIRFRLYDKDMQYLYEFDFSHFTYYMASGEQYYVRVYSTTAAAQTATLTYSAVESMEQGMEYTITESYPVMYRFTAPSMLTETTYYTIVFKDFGNDFNAEVYGNSSPISYASATNFYSMNLTMEPGEEIYIQMESSSPFTVTINQSENLFTWTVDGEEQEDSTVLLQRGKKYQIGLKIDGVPVDNIIYSDNGLLKGTTLDLTSYQYITDPKSDETYLSYFAIENNSPVRLKICVTHNFNFQFDTYNNNLGYGFTWKDLSSDPSETFNINYTVTAGGNSTKDTKVLQVRNASSQSVMSAVTESLVYSGCEDITIVIDSVELEIKDIYGTFRYRATIYNTESEQYNMVSDIREQYQNFTCAALKVNPLFDGGSGTSEDPFQIKYYRHFDNIRKVTSYDDDFGKYCVFGYYILTENIILSSSFKPLDEGYAYFSGSIDGNGKTIMDLKVSGKDKQIGLIQNNYATISDLTFSNV